VNFVTRNEIINSFRARCCRRSSVGLSVACGLIIVMNCQSVQVLERFVVGLPVMASQNLVSRPIFESLGIEGCRSRDFGYYKEMA